MKDRNDLEVIINNQRLIMDALIEMIELSYGATKSRTKLQERQLELYNREKERFGG